MSLLRLMIAIATISWSISATADQYYYLYKFLDGVYIEGNLEGTPGVDAYGKYVEVTKPIPQIGTDPGSKISAFVGALGVAESSFVSAPDYGVWIADFSSNGGFFNNVATTNVYFDGDLNDFMFYGSLDPYAYPYQSSSATTPDNWFAMTRFQDLPVMDTTVTVEMYAPQVGLVGYPTESENWYPPLSPVPTPGPVFPPPPVNSHLSGGWLLCDVTNPSLNPDKYACTSAGAWLSDGTRILNGSTSTPDGLILPVPEPETWAILLAGLGLLGVLMRRKKQQAA